MHVSIAGAFASHIIAPGVGCRGPCCAMLIARSALHCCGNCSDCLLFDQICFFRFLVSDSFVQIRVFVSSDLFIQILFFRFNSSDSFAKKVSGQLSET